MPPISPLGGYADPHPVGDTCSSLCVLTELEIRGILSNTVGTLVASTYWTLIHSDLVVCRQVNSTISLRFRLPPTCPRGLWDEL